MRLEKRERDVLRLHVPFLLEVDKDLKMTAVEETNADFMLKYAAVQKQIARTYARKTRLKT